MKVAYLGPKGTFSHQVCTECFKVEELIECKTIKICIEYLEQNLVDKIIIPIENSLQGGVTESIDNIIKNEDIYVVDEYVLEIEQNLISKEIYNFEDIKQIYSHPQAIAQCKKFLEDNFLNCEIIETYSTAKAAQIVSEKENCACIGSVNCINEYNLKLIKNSIQDNRFNKTRFWILSKKAIFKDDAEKMSIIFSVKDKPGALYNVLGIFNKHNINLTKIESRPAKTVLGEYIFLIDLEITNNLEEMAIKEIKEQGLYVRILGKY